MKNIINFAENRNIYMPSLKMKIELLKTCKRIYEYPDYKNTIVNDCLSNYFNIQKEYLTVTNGSLEGINLLANIMEKKDAIIFNPTFWGYEDAFKRWNYHIDKKELINNIDYDLVDIDKQAKLHKVIFLCNPNNPTLSYISKDLLLKLISNNANCHFIIDETMLIFDEEYERKTILKEVKNFDNLSVVVSLSKFLGIAGLRTGVLFSNEQVIQKVKKSSIPYSLGIIQQAVLPIAFDNEEYLLKTKKLISNNRKELCGELNKINCKIIDGNTNFILVNLPKGIDANDITNYLYQNNIEVRNIKEAYPELIGDWLRISIQSPKNNRQLIKKMNECIKGGNI